MNDKTFAPPAVARLVRASLADAERPAYCQVATVDGRGRAQVRTVHLRLLPEQGTLGFSCHVDSPKVGQLLRARRLSGCWVDLHRLAQFRWEGTARLIHPRRGTRAERALLDRLWLLMRPDVRQAYWLDHLGQAGGTRGFSVDERAPGSGVVVCFPERWDVFRMNPQDYTQGRRTLYARTARGWASRRVSLLHGKPLKNQGRTCTRTVLCKPA